MKIKSNDKAGGQGVQHYQTVTRSLKAKSGIKVGSPTLPLPPASS